VTTLFGARGYAINHAKHAMICPLEQFPDQIRQLIGSPEQRQNLGNAAFHFAEAHLDWKLQANKFRNVLERTIFASGKRKLWW